MKHLIIPALILGYMLGEYDRPTEDYTVPNELKAAVLEGMHYMYEAGRLDSRDDIGLVWLTVEDVEELI